MKIESIEVLPVKISKAPIYLGATSTTNSDHDYYIRPEYRSIYSKNLETLLVKITTDDGIIGWGECLAPVGPEIVGVIIEKLFKQFLLGKDPRDIDVIWSTLYNSMRERGYFTGFMVDAITAVDIALWDIFGKSVDLPVYKLLGGAYRKNIACYVSGLPKDSLEEKIELAHYWKNKGFNAIKLHLGYNIKEDTMIMARLREELGNEFNLMIDAHWKYTAPEAIKLGKNLSPYNISFLEAPTLAEDIDGNALITNKSEIPIALGEAIRTKYQFKERLVKRAADILQPDVGRVGITEMKKIASLAETFGIPIAPHLSVGLGVCIAATLQVSASIPNFYLLEYQPTVFSVANKLLKSPIICEEGFYKLPENPGIGVEVDEEKLKELSITFSKEETR